jgi:hypothetical protein
MLFQFAIIKQIITADIMVTPNIMLPVLSLIFISTSLPPLPEYSVGLSLPLVSSLLQLAAALRTFHIPELPQLCWPDEADITLVTSTGPLCFVVRGLPREDLLQVISFR